MSAPFAKTKPPAAAPETAPEGSRTVAELNDVHLSFDKQQILRGITLDVQEKERLVVLGKSGGGKSTLLRLILGILKPNRGEVLFKGLSVNRMGRRRLNRMREKMGMVYQYSALISSLNVRQNVALPLEELTEKPAREIEDIVREKLSLVGMEEATEKMPAQLSGGMRKRVALARGLVLDPELILYDEPSAGLDPITSAAIDELMISLSEKTGTTSIIVTHEMDSAFKVATRMAMLHEGRIIADGTPEEFRNHPNEIVAQFVSGAPTGPLTESPPK